MGGSASITETFKAITAAYLAEEYEKCWALIDPEVEWVEPASLPGAATYRGHDGVAASLSKFVGTWTDYRIEHSGFEEAGDRLFIRVHLSGKGRSSGTPMEVDQFQVCTFRDGKLARLEMHFDESEARRAAGLEPLAKEQT